MLYQASHTGPTPGTTRETMNMPLASSPSIQSLEMLARSAIHEDERRIHPASTKTNDRCVASNAEGQLEGVSASQQEHYYTQRSVSMYPSSAPPRGLPSLRDITRHLPEARSDNDARPPSRAPEHNPRVRLSVYESPRATYTWPRFDPTSVSASTEKPVIYVTYKEAADMPAGDKRSSTCSSSEAEMSEPSSMYAEYHRDTYSRKRNSSIESECSSNGPVGSLFKQARYSYNNRPQHNHARPSTRITLSLAEFDPGEMQVRRELQDSFQGLGIRREASETDASNGPGRHSVETTSTMVPPDALAGRGKQARAKPVRKPLFVLKSDDEWLQYTKPFKAPGPEGFRGLKCTWQEPKKGSEGGFVRCTYIQKRHLVKRHICSKHLGIRPWGCRECGKTFAQLSNLETHENTHTGERPHECPFCNERFKDPARQYRHKKDVHGYVTARERKMMSEVYGTSDPELTDSDRGETDEHAASSYARLMRRGAAPPEAQRVRLT